MTTHDPLFSERHPFLVEMTQRGLLCRSCGSWALKYNCSICEDALCERCGFILPNRELACAACYERKVHP